MDLAKAKKWLERHLWATRSEGPVVRIVVRHLSVDGRSGTEEIWSAEVPHNGSSVTIEPDQIPVMLADIESTCLEDAAGIGEGLQKYKIQVYVQNKSPSHGRFSFSIGIDDEGNVNDTGMSEPANLKGMLAQNQRHLENVMKISTATTIHMMTTLQRANLAQSEHIEALTREKRETISLVEGLKSEQHERDLATYMAETKAKSQSALMEKAGLLIPAMVNRVAGQKLLPEGNPTVDLLKGLAESLSDSQMAGILKTLSPEQQLVMIDFMNSTQPVTTNSDESDGDSANALISPIFGGTNKGKK
tara:strand:- start:8761 stop:9669 length:909 start_codon:yes stop_codon:yes gene_type:complete